MIAETLQDIRGIPQTLHYQGVGCMESVDGVIIMFMLVSSQLA